MPPDCVCTRIYHHIDHFLLPNSVYVQPNPFPFQRFKKSDIDYCYTIFPWNQPMVTEIESLLCVYSTMSWPAEVVQSKCYHFDHDANMKSPLPSRTLSPAVTYFTFYTQPSAPSVSNESSCENIWLVFVCLKPTPSALLDIKGFVKWFFFSDLFRPHQLQTYLLSQSCLHLEMTKRVNWTIELPLNM